MEQNEQEKQQCYLSFVLSIASALFSGQFRLRAAYKDTATFETHIKHYRRPISRSLSLSIPLSMFAFICRLRYFIVLCKRFLSLNALYRSGCRRCFCLCFENGRWTRHRKAIEQPKIYCKNATFFRTPFFNCSIVTAVSIDVLRACFFFFHLAVIVGAYL